MKLQKKFNKYINNNHIHKVNGVMQWELVMMDQ